ncbi:Exoenzyme S synthesis regulatory protein ExsA [Aquimixticola soesokkakensis]|uniref:Exoenzyme S synthesis regulatory protein ExsA n=1 Tax=Aquimixticola soesokkakensis TaxID=1519096 RepID=A0A1Y5T6N7_9RHOB|nr:AraC family transcriptional regulator [Aquimixticola soesokkakensis]SLN54977.1 Exoenzyme S synthesis regulatory protein ExsA [Aquimixticola soesokkakensis]
MLDPLADIVTMLRPRAVFSKQVVAYAPWRVHRAEAGRPFYCLMLEGQCRLEGEGQAAIEVQTGDFVLIPEAQQFVMSHDAAGLAQDGAQERAQGGARVACEPVQLAEGVFRLGAATGAASARFLVGYCAFETPDAPILVSLLPRLVHVRADPRLAMLVQLIRDETGAHRPAREVILNRLLEVLLIEGLRGATEPSDTGLLRGLADHQIAIALRGMHEAPAQAWTVRELARAAGLSRSAFFDRFTRLVGVPPMEHLSNWRMALAKWLLRDNVPIARVAERVGYSSPATFGTAFRKRVGMSPARFARAETASASSVGDSGQA